MTRIARLRAAKRGSRRSDFSAATRRRLVDRATELFTERGYAGTSLDEVVAAADVTKGALYHHYSGKQALFEAVYTATETAAVQHIVDSISAVDDPWDRATAAVRSFTEVCRQPSFRRIVMQEGPVALGFDSFREAEERNTYGLVRDIVRPLLEPYDVPADLVETFTRVFYGAMTSAGLTVASADDPEVASRQVETVMGVVLAGLRQLAGSGSDLLDRSAVSTP